MDNSLLETLLEDSIFATDVEIIQKLLFPPDGLIFTVIRKDVAESLLLV